MPYAIVQKTLEPPSFEQLKAAFRALPQLTDVDAGPMAKDAFGILIQGLEMADAGRLLQALHAAGVEAEMVDEQSLPPLPPPRPCRRAQVRPDAFVAHDHLGRAHEIEWPHVILIAAGAVATRELKHVTEERVVGYNAGASRYGAGEAAQIIRVDHKDIEEEHVRLWLELFLDIAPARYHITADKFNFAYLGDRMTSSRTRNYLALVSDCVGCASGAFLNRGAAAIGQEPPTMRKYPSKHAFEEETVWQLWRHFGAGREL